MIKTWLKRRKALLAPLALSAAVVLTPALPPEVDAADCDSGGTQSTTYAWVVTPEAQAQTDAGACGSNAVCRQWCLVSCDDVQTYPAFQCFAE